MYGRGLTRGSTRAWLGPRGPAPHAGRRRTVALERDGHKGLVMLLRHVIFRSPIFRLLHHARVRIVDAARKATSRRDTAREYVASSVPGDFTRRVPARASSDGPDAWPAWPRGAPSERCSRMIPTGAGRRRTPPCACFVPRHSAALYARNGFRDGKSSDERHPHDFRVTQGSTWCCLTGSLGVTVRRAKASLPSRPRSLARCMKASGTDRPFERALFAQLRCRTHTHSVSEPMAARAKNDEDPQQRKSHLRRR